MRSASMPLFGLEETRISWPVTRAVDPSGVPFSAKGADGTLEPPLQVRRSIELVDAAAKKKAKAPGYSRALFAVGANAEVFADFFAFPLPELLIEEKVNYPFRIVTEHSEHSFPRV